MTKLKLIGRTRAEASVPLFDCSGRVYPNDEREDLIRYVLEGAEIQRDLDEYDAHTHRQKGGHRRE